MNKSLIEAQAGYDEPEDDLNWLARNVHEWPTECLLRSHGVVLEADRTVTAIYRQYADQTTSDRTYTKDEWLTRRAELQNKPNWDDAPELVKWIAQWSDGQWLGYEVEPECGNKYDPDDCYIDPRDKTRIHAFEYGEVLGDWRNTLEKRPDLQHNPEDVAFIAIKKEGNHEPLSDLAISIKPTTYRPSMSELYPNYYKDVSSLTEVDVYAIHDLFGIDDPSGCIQHASKKLLLCGVRTGGKPAATEIKEARDTLTRKLQLMGEE